MGLKLPEKEGVLETFRRNLYTVLSIALFTGRNVRHVKKSQSAQKIFFLQRVDATWHYSRRRTVFVFLFV